ncbi:MAG: Gfo/Idh/MocA family oxidoreductase, partial [Victivallales bacterium]|nr:Gfo/Idh/MocA family oxidoreductase [Victivallales bacterium]
GLKWYDSREALLADQEIQAVFVATNNRTHVEVAEAALRAGKHVIVEKPLATTSEDARRLIAIAAEAGLSIFVDHMMTGNAWNRLARKMVADGDLGKVNDACFHMEFAYGYAPEEANSWRCSRIDEMGGPIGDVASHCFYLAEYILGSEIRSLAAAYIPKTMDIVAENGAYIKAVLENGCHLSVKVAFSELRGGAHGALGNSGFEIYGDKGVLRSYGTMAQLSGHPGEIYPQQLLLDDFTGTFKQMIPAADDVKNIYQRLITAHACSIIEGKPLKGGDAYHNMLLCEYSHLSAQQNGKVIEL